MNGHLAIEAGRVAVVTGAASGIGLAAAKRFAALGLSVALADLGGDRLVKAEAEVAALAKSPAKVRAFPTDVGKIGDMRRLHDDVLQTFGEVAVLMNNAAIDGGGGTWKNIERWRQVLDVNLWGVINGVQVFAKTMIDQKKPGAIVNTGSKQGITTPPGDAAYNVSKAGVKVVTEQLAHELRETPGCDVTAHLLIPGFTFTGLTKGVTEKPRDAWTADEVVGFMLERLAAGDFYILCPDHAVTRAMDEKRMSWAMQDIIQNRPALSRWHKDYKQSFEDFMKKD